MQDQGNTTNPRGMKIADVHVLNRSVGRARQLQQQAQVRNEAPRDTYITNEVLGKGGKVKGIKVP